MLPRLLALASLGLLSIGCTTRTIVHVYPRADVAEVALQSPLRTEMFESGGLTLETVNDIELEAFRQDLVRRRDYDLSQHGVEPGPDHAYLSVWVDRVDAELLRRGYHSRAEATLYRPDGSPVPRVPAAAAAPAQQVSAGVR